MPDKQNNKELVPCSHCASVNLEVVTVDFINDHRDIIKCRICGSRSTRMWWNKRYYPKDMQLVSIDDLKRCHDTGYWTDAMIEAVEGNDSA